MVTLNATFMSNKVQKIITDLRLTYAYITDMNVTSAGKLSMSYMFAKYLLYTVVN